MNIEKADKKQIEEMAQIINGSTELDTIAYYRCMNIAKTLYNADYRKLPEDSIVISREELSKKYVSKDTYDSEIEYRKVLEKRERKKIVKEILQEIRGYYQVDKEHCNNGELFILNLCEDIASRYDVGVEAVSTEEQVKPAYEKGCKEIAEKIAKQLGVEIKE